MALLSGWANYLFLFIIWENAMFVVECQNYTSCADLPKVNTNVKELIENSPIGYHYGLTPAYNCSQDVFINPPKGQTDFNATVLLVQHSVNVVPLKLEVVNSGGNITNKITICQTGDVEWWNIMVSKFSSNGGGYLCLYRCGNDNVSLAEFKCGATNESYIPDEQPYLDLMKNIPYEDTKNVIRNLYSNCPKPEHCSTTRFA